MEKTNTGVITPETEFLGQLRARTAALHQYLEDLPLSKSLMSEAVTPATYAWYLTCMQDVMAVYDEHILPIIEDQVPQASDRLKHDVITADLLSLKADGVDLDESLPLKVPQIQDDAFAWGMAYVIEGSTLGGRVILKHITPKLGVTEERGARFFAGYGPDTGMMWKSFLAALTAYAVDQNAGEQIIKGALAGFGMIANHFETNGMLE